MTKIKYIYLLLISAILFGACSKDDMSGGIEVSDDEVAISYSLKKYVQVVTSGNSSKSASETRNINIEAGDEEKIDNLYIIMFDATTSGAAPIKYFVDNTFPAVDGEWNQGANPSVKLKKTQAQVGNRNVYVIANVTPALRSALNASTLTTIADLEAVYAQYSNPWSEGLTPVLVTGGNKYPILMSGNESHNFSTNPVLNKVTLVRALAKVELNVKLPAKHQAAQTYLSNGVELPNYQYNFVDFDKNTYVLENTSKPANQKASTGNSANTPATWVPFSAIGTDHVSSYEVDNVSGLVTNLKIVTYINETTNANSYIEIQLPYEDGGFLPPPEFGPETFILPRQGKIERNHWYIYDVEL